MTMTGQAPTSSRRRLPNARKGLAPGLVGAVLGVILSGVLNSTLVGMPHGTIDNLLHQGVSGLVSGVAGGFVGMLLHLRTSPGATDALPGNDSRSAPPELTEPASPTQPAGAAGKN